MKRLLHDILYKHFPAIWLAIKYHVENEYQNYICTAAEIAPYGNTLRKQHALDPVFRGIVKDKTILEIGCDTGFFPLYAATLGARQATGVDRNRHALAKAESARLKMRMRQVDFRYGLVPRLDITDTFDTVMFLSAIHYMFSETCGNKLLFTEMDAFIEYISAYAREYLVIEFVEPHDDAARMLVAEKVIAAGEYSEAALLKALHSRYATIIDLGTTHYSTRRLFLACRQSAPALPVIEA